MSAIIEKARDLDHLLAVAVQDDAEAGLYRCRRDIFTNEDLFELEMKHIFEGNWVYLAHESQIPAVNDYYTTWIGRQPVVITRDKAGSLNAVINACAHKGAMLCRRKQGNKGSFTCPFHGWTFSNTGKLLKVKDAKTTQYPDQFNKDGSHDLTRVARFENYRGFRAALRPVGALDRTRVGFGRGADRRDRRPDAGRRVAGARPSAGPELPALRRPGGRLDPRDAGLRARQQPSSRRRAACRHLIETIRTACGRSRPPLP